MRCLTHLDYFGKCTNVSIVNIQLFLPPYTTYARNIKPIQTLKDVSVSQLTVPTNMQVNSTAENTSGFLELGKLLGESRRAPFELFWESTICIH